MKHMSSQLLAKLQAEEMIFFGLLDITIDDETFRFTDCELPLIIDGHTYTPVPLQPGNVSFPANSLVSSFNFKLGSNIIYDGEVSAYSTMKDVFVFGSPTDAPVLARIVFLDPDYYAECNTNLLTNPGFETGALGDWNLEVSSDCVASASVVGSGAYAGTYCAKITITDGWGDSVHIPHPQDILFQQQLSCDINAGYLYDISFAAKADSARRIAVDVGLPGGSEFPIFYNVELTDEWQFFNLSFIAPDDIAESELPNLNFYLARSNSNADVYIDQVRFSNGLHPITIFKGTIDRVGINPTEWIDISVTNVLATWDRKPVRRQPTLCRWTKFKGDECRYAGAETECDRTYTRCEELSNTAHFGGFRWLLKIMTQTLYWGKIPLLPNIAKGGAWWRNYDATWMQTPKY